MQNKRNFFRDEKWLEKICHLASSWYSSASSTLMSALALSFVCACAHCDLLLAHAWFLALFPHALLHACHHALSHVHGLVLAFSLTCAVSASLSCFLSYSLSFCLLKIHCITVCAQLENKVW